MFLIRNLITIVYFIYVFHRLKATENCLTRGYIIEDDFFCENFGPPAL